MTDTATPTAFQGHVTAGDVELWVDQRGSGPDVFLIAGLSDPAESWGFQLDGLAGQYRVTAFDNRGAGRSPMVPDGFTVGDMADDAAAIMRTLGIEHAHVMGFSGGSCTAQELALRHPDLVSSLVLDSTWARADTFLRTMMQSWLWLVETAPSERAMLEAFFIFVYTARAHDDGTVAAIIDEALGFEFAQEPEGFRRQLETWFHHDTYDRLPSITVPTMVVAGAEDIITPARYGRIVADRIAGAELVVLEGEAHQPFQESADAFNALVTDFWAGVEQGEWTMITVESIEAGGVRLHVEQAGAGEPIVFVHGGFTDGQAWRFVAPGLAADHRVVTYDRRGHSRSERGATPATRRVEEDDLIALVEVLDLAPVHLVASSYGASIALGVTTRRPELVETVVAHEPALLDLVVSPELAEVRVAFEAIGSRIAAGDVSGATSSFVDELILGPGWWDQLPDATREVMLANAGTVVDMLADPGWAALDVEALGASGVPVLVTDGDASPAWLRAIAAALGALAPVGRRTYSGAGHMPHITHPGDVEAAVRARR